jgi:hypothetical protein
VAGVDRRLFLLASLALGGCATVGVAPAGPPGPPGPLAELEPLRAATTTREGMTIRVASHGCTAKADFAFYVERRGGAATLAFGRRRVDVCKAPAEADLMFTWAELGLDPKGRVFLLNPVGPAR